MLVALLTYNCSVYISPLDQHVSNHLSTYTPVSILLGGKETPVLLCNSMCVCVHDIIYNPYSSYITTSHMRNVTVECHVCFEENLQFYFWKHGYLSRQSKDFLDGLIIILSEHIPGCFWEILKIDPTSSPKLCFDTHNLVSSTFHFLNHRT